MALTPAENRLRTLLRVLVVLFGGAALIYEAGPFITPLRAFFQQLPFVTNSAVKVSVMALMCLYAWGDVRRRSGLVVIVIAGHLLSIAAMGVVLVAGDTNHIAPLGAGMPIRNALWGAMALDGVVTLLLVIFYIGARRAAAAVVPRPTPAATPVLTAAENRMRIAAIAFGVLFALAAVAYEAGPLVASLRDFFIELPFVTNSVVKVGVLAMLCFYVARDIRENLSVFGLVIVAHIISPLAQLIMFLGDTSTVVTVAGQSQTIGSMLWGSIALDAVFAVIMFVLYLAAWTARFELAFFRPIEYRTLAALGEVLVSGPDERVPAADVAANVERYVQNIRARRRWIYRVVLFGMYLHPLLYLKPPFSELDEDTRLEHIKKHFNREVLLRLVPEWWRRLVQAMIRICQQLHIPRLLQRLAVVRVCRLRAVFGAAALPVSADTTTRASSARRPNAGIHPVRISHHRCGRLHYRKRGGGRDARLPSRESGAGGADRGAGPLRGAARVHRG